MERKYKTVTIILIVIWLVVYLIIDSLSRLEGFAPVFSTLPLSVWDCLFYCVTLFFLYPLLYLIRHNAKLAGMKKVYIVTLVLIIIFTIWLPMYVVGMLVLYGG